MSKTETPPVEGRLTKDLTISRERNTSALRRGFLSGGMRFLSLAGPTLARIGFIRNPLVRAMEENLRETSIRAA